MARSPVGDESTGGSAGGSVKKGPWTPEEDRKLMEYVEKHGRGSWQRIPKLAGLNRCGKSCRLRWTNYLRPDIKRGKFNEEEEQLIIHLHSLLGNRWSSIATKLPGRTDNEIKNYWNTHLRKKLLRMGIDPVTHRPTTAATNLNLLAGLLSFPSVNLGAAATHLDATIKLQADLAHLLKLQLVQSLFQVLASADSGSSSNPAPPPPLPNMNLLSLLGTPNSATNSVPTDQNLAILGKLLNDNNIDFSMDREELVTASDASRSEEASMEISNVSSTSSYFPASNSTPHLVSSQAKNVDLAKSSISCMHADESLASTSFDGWENLKLDNLDNNDFGWKDIIDQMSWSDEP